MHVDERLLKYVSCFTTSCEDSDTIPSTDRQFTLAKELEKELLDLGLQKVAGIRPLLHLRSDSCYSGIRNQKSCRIYFPYGYGTGFFRRER